MRTRQLASTFLSTLLGAALTAASAWASPTVQTPNGALTGLSGGDGVQRFLGIPYAKPPVGDLRWRAPQPAEPWAGTRDATRFGSSCPQAADMFGPASVNEDCLTLNVYSPETPSATPRPVLVYIHGGGFWSGAGSYYDGAVLAREIDAVVVTINYRLGVFGFLSTTGVRAENKALNFGLQDQFAALGWVQKQIGAFGGDPSRVTISGQSAGAGAACLALISPKSAGLFHRAIMHSAPCTMATAPLSKAIAKGDGMATKAGCPTGPGQMACLRSKPAADLLAAAQITVPYKALSESFWPATIDGDTVPSAVMAALTRGQFQRVPVMLGTTQDEGKGLIGWGFHGIFGRSVTQDEYNSAMKDFAGDLAGGLVTAFYPASRYGSVDLALGQALTDVALACPNHTAANALSAQVPTYAFEFADTQAPQFFDDALSPKGWGAYHMGELLYVFGTPVSGLSFPGLSPAQQTLSEQMQNYWRQFVATGNPNGMSGNANGVAPSWPRYTKTGTALQSLKPGAIVTQTHGEYQKAHQCGVWSSYYSLGAFFGMY